MNFEHYGFVNWFVCTVQHVN